MNEPLAQVGRLAMRVEGDWWAAYYAMPHTMEGALLLGRIQMAFVQSYERQGRFMLLMRDAVGDLIEQSTGVRPVWPNPPAVAPEHERAGRG
jgi:hypothetical protein